MYGFGAAAKNGCRCAVLYVCVWGGGGWVGVVHIVNVHAYLSPFKNYPYSMFRMYMCDIMHFHHYITSSLTSLPPYITFSCRVRGREEC